MRLPRHLRRTPALPVRDEHGVVLSTRLLALAISAVAMAALVFVANDPDEVGRADEATPVTSEPSASATPTPSATPSETPKPAKPKPIRRGDTYVVVFNNTGVTGLAGGVAGRAEAGGWNVVGSDNWYGTVDATAVYYPPRLEREAQALSKDLGIGQVKKAVEPMQLDRLTVILTDDYSG